MFREAHCLSYTRLIPFLVTPLFHLFSLETEKLYTLTLFLSVFFLSKLQVLALKCLLEAEKIGQHAKQEDLSLILRT